jgi:DNA polymerase-3 subunit epsilon
LVRVTNGAIVDTARRLIRPPKSTIKHTSIHGLRWADLKDQPRFCEVWTELSHMLDGADFLAAHWAAFDKSVLRASCMGAGMVPPDLPFLCTVALAREAWNIYPTKLPDVARALELSLDHHEPLSDALACANIVLRGSGAVSKVLRNM